MQLDILIEDPRWTPLMLDQRAETAVATALAHVSLPADRVEISLLACDDARIATLNADFRGKPVPTNVLSWPNEDLNPDMEGARPYAPTPEPDGTIHLGDIAIAYDTCAREAKEQGKSLEAHVTHLTVHGVLHLLGYDHIRDQDATLMERMETEILGKMGLDDPYRA